MAEPAGPAPMRPTLSLPYGALPPEKLAAMESWGKAQGLPLEALERLGQDEGACDAYLDQAVALRPPKGRLRLPPAVRA